MPKIKSRSSCFFSRIIDLIVLTSSFLLLVLITDLANSMQILVDLSFYVFVMFISLRVSKRIILENIHTSGRITGVLLGNITGLVVGAVLVISLNQFIPEIGESVLIVIFSSILAFFILGTLSPLVKSSHNDIIHH